MAITNLGLLYFQGQGVPQSYENPPPLWNHPNGPVPGPAGHTCPILAEDEDYDSSDDDDTSVSSGPANKNPDQTSSSLKTKKSNGPANICTVCGDDMGGSAA